QLTLKHGARMAEPGEFTKRAFLNGRIDLSQAEGVMDFIRSKTTEASKVANQQMQGRLKTYVESLRQSILDRKSTRLNSSHVSISYAVFCLKKKKQTPHAPIH